MQLSSYVSQSVSESGMLRLAVDFVDGSYGCNHNQYNASLSVSGPNSGSSSSAGTSASVELPYVEGTYSIMGTVTLYCDCINGPLYDFRSENVAVQQPPQPTVSVTNADIVADQIAVSLAPAQLSGNLVIRVGTAQVFSGQRSAGNYTFSFNRNSLPSASYSSVIAEWTTPNGVRSGSRPVGFTVLGQWRHSQYNSPNESACTAAPAPAFVTNPSCVFTATNLKADFISQSWLNGSGITINFGSEQNEDSCLRSGTPPANASGRSFRPQSIVPSCRAGYSVNNGTVAAGDNSGLNCGDQVLIVGVGVKTVTDRCPLCTGKSQLDNYTTQAACSPGTIPDLGTFQTIRLR